MTSESAVLHGMALLMAADGTAEAEAVEQLVDAAEGSQTALLGAVAWSRSLRRELPLDLRAQRSTDLLEAAVVAAAARPSPPAARGRIAMVPSEPDSELYTDMDRLRGPTPTE